jgi:hypothetical protein
MNADNTYCLIIGIGYIIGFVIISLIQPTFILSKIGALFFGCLFIILGLAIKQK